MHISKHSKSWKPKTHLKKYFRPSGTGRPPPRKTGKREVGIVIFLFFCSIFIPLPLSLKSASRLLVHFRGFCSGCWFRDLGVQGFRV